MGCLAAKPIVNGIEKDLRGTAEVIRLDILSDVGQQVAGRYRVDSVPTTVLLGPGNQVAYHHVGMPERGKIVGLARGY